ncbi:H-NS family nucleoid-associated regulatory protein [Klebsiella pneumoniae]|uniref:H-NS histone family protein n=1 Tax=Klebsiella pneumoniae TaxID=573 RepID=UPI00397047EC
MLVPLKSEKRPKGEPVYRDPDNPFNTWTGIGKRPAWLTAKLDAGISRSHEDAGRSQPQRT